MENVIQAVLTLAVISSFIVYGLSKTLTKAFQIEKIPVPISLSLVYMAGLACAIIYWHEIPVFPRGIANGIVIGCVAVGIYEAAVKSLLGIIPALIERLLGSSGKKPGEGNPE